MALEIVADLIARVEAKHPRLGRAAMATYYEAVHQELAPLARALEQRVAELEAELLAQATIQRKQWRDHSTLRRMKAETPGSMLSIFKCPKCSNEYRAGTSPVTVYAENGRVSCRACNPNCLPSLATTMNERLEPRCPKSP